jgi:hypothetical protein
MEVGHKDFTKKKPDQLVYLELGAGNGGMLLSISEDGFRFRAVSPVRANGSMPFAFSLDGHQRFEGIGTVEWLEDDGKSGGMRFTEISEEFRAALGKWFSSQHSHHPPGREVTPAAATPLDTMEKIRRELRSGYPTRPITAESVAQFQGSSQPRVEKPIPDRKPKVVFPERKLEVEDSPAAGRPFPQPARTAPDKEKTAPEKERENPETVSSAFLRSLKEARPQQTLPASPSVPSDSSVPSAPVAPVGSAPRAVPPAQTAPAAPFSRLKPEETRAPVESRPFVPAFEESFEQAWEHAKLSAPPDSPHLSRAAAGGIIAIALAVILGALAYNFRQDIGTAFIQLGQSISGDKRASIPAEETKPENQPTSQQNRVEKTEQATVPSQSASTDKENGAASNSTLAPQEGASGAAKSGSPAAKNGAPSTGNPQGPGFVAVPLPAKPSDNSSAQPPADTGAREITSAEMGSGQDEFNSAREILRGNSRQRDLPRAVDLLWAGVRKGYVPAEVTLADLFRRGDGVEKNCDQARVLLVAASKKGSLDARQMLEQMAERGCD